MSDHPEDPNVRHDVGGWISGPCLPEPVTPGSTPLRMLARAVADALSLPPPRADHDEQLRARVLDQRAKVVASALRRLSDDIEADSMDVVLTASSIRDRCSQIEVSYSVNPLAQ